MARHLRPERETDLYLGITASLVKHFITTSFLPVAVVNDIIRDLLGELYIYSSIETLDITSEAFAEILESFSNYQDTFIFGRMLGDLGAELVATGKGLAGLVTIIDGFIKGAASVTIGAAGTVGSGGTATIPSIAISTAGITTAAAEITAGVAVEAQAKALAASARKDFDEHKGESDYFNKLYCAGKDGQPSELSIDNKQLGKKYGKHRSDYPGLRSGDYKELAEDIFSNPDEVRFGYANGETRHLEYFYIRGNDVVRVLPDGTFVSLYPGVLTDDIQSAIILFTK